jgi:hypothetical protein
MPLALKRLLQQADDPFAMRHDRAHRHDGESPWFPSKGERIELLDTQLGVRLRGTVHYSDRLQVLVKWDNGRSQSLRPGVDRFRLID